MRTWKKKLAAFLSLIMLISVIPLQAYSLEDQPDEGMPERSESPVEEGLETVGGSEIFDEQEESNSQEKVGEEETSEDQEVPIDQDTSSGQEGLDNEMLSEDSEDLNSSIIPDAPEDLENLEQSSMREDFQAIFELEDLFNDDNIEEYRRQKEMLLQQGVALTTVNAVDVDYLDPYDTTMIANDYIEVSVNGRGEFTVGTREGNPDSDTDNYQNLLFGHPYPGTSETLIRIDGNDYIFSNYTTSVEVKDNACLATATIGGVEVEQVLSLQTNPYTGIEDVVSIRYQYTNNSNATKQVGVRIMMDTMLGGNDGSPFRVNGLDVTTETEYTGNSVPQYWQSFYSLDDPQVVSTGFFYFDVMEKPDRVQFASWPGIVASPWNYQISPDRSVTGDSAVAAYFNPKAVAAGGGTGSVVTYYGVSGFSTDNSFLQPPLAVRVTAPSKLSGSNDIGGYLNNPFNISVYMTNNSDNKLNNIKVDLDLTGITDKLTYAYGQTTGPIPIGDMAIGESRTAQWNLQAVPQSAETPVSYKILFYEDGKTDPIKTVNMDLTLGAIDAAHMYCTVSFDMNGKTGTPPNPESIKVTNFGTTITAPTPPVCEDDDYVFVGWYRDSECTVPWVFDQDTVTVNTRLYAGWRELDLGFEITGINGVNNENIYIVNASDDTYYDMGVRTVLVSDSSLDLEHIILKYEVDDLVKVTVEDVEQTSELSDVDFSRSLGKAVKYTVASPSGRSSRDYWVTVIRPQEDVQPQLFVNAANIDDDEFKTRVLLMPVENSYHNSK